MIQSQLMKSVPTLKHGFFTRNGGVSTGMLSSLNFSLSKGDSTHNIMKNRERAMSHLEIDSKHLSTIHQIHGNTVHTLTEPIKFLDPLQSLKGDGLVTNNPNIALGIISADCVPVIFTDRDKRIVGAAHAGWRGALQGVLEKTLGTMRGLGAETIFAALGPCIHQAYYEIGIEVYEAFTLENSDHARHFQPTARKGFYLFNLPGFVEARLNAAGIEKIENLNQDTYSNEDKFFSCRRAYHNHQPTFGCQLSVIMIQDS